MGNRPQVVKGTTGGRIEVARDGTLQMSGWEVHSNGADGPADEIIVEAVIHFLADTLAMLQARPLEERFGGVGTQLSPITDNRKPH